MWAPLIALVILTESPQQSLNVSSVEVTAKYSSGLSLEDPCWTVTLKEPGESSLELCGKEPRIIVVSQEHFANLRETLSSERFFELRDDYGDLQVDGPESQMEVRLGRKFKRVSIHSIKPRMPKRESDEVDRAMKVWFAIQDCFQPPAKHTSP